MTIKVGDKIPSVAFKQLTASGMKDLATDAVFADKNMVMFSVPGAFTPTCSTKHLPGFIQHISDFMTNGIEVSCLSVNDPFVMKAWQDMHKANGITMIADGNGAFTEALGLELDGTGYGLGHRSQRFALYAENGIVRHLAVEKPGAFEVSSAEAMLNVIHNLKSAAA